MTLDAHIHTTVAGIVPADAPYRDDLLRRVALAQSPQQRAVLARQLGWDAYAAYYTDRPRAQVLDRVSCVLREHSRETVRGGK